VSCRFAAIGGAATLIKGMGGEGLGPQHVLQCRVQQESELGQHLLHLVGLSGASGQRFDILAVSRQLEGLKLQQVEAAGGDEASVAASASEAEGEAGSSRAAAEAAATAAAAARSRPDHIREFFRACEALPQPQPPPPAPEPQRSSGDAADGGSHTAAVVAVAVSALATHSAGEAAGAAVIEGDEEDASLTPLLAMTRLGIDRPLLIVNVPPDCQRYSQLRLRHVDALFWPDLEICGEDQRALIDYEQRAALRVVVTKPRPSKQAAAAARKGAAAAASKPPARKQAGEAVEEGRGQRQAVGQQQPGPAPPKQRRVYADDGEFSEGDADVVTGEKLLQRAEWRQKSEEARSERAKQREERLRQRLTQQQSTRQQVQQDEGGANEVVPGKKGKRDQGQQQQQRQPAKQLKVEGDPRQRHGSSGQMKSSKRKRTEFELLTEVVTGQEGSLQAERMVLQQDCRRSARLAMPLPPPAATAAAAAVTAPTRKQPPRGLALSSHCPPAAHVTRTAVAAAVLVRAAAGRKAARDGGGGLQAAAAAGAVRNSSSTATIPILTKRVLRSRWTAARGDAEAAAEARRQEAAPDSEPSRSSGSGGAAALAAHLADGWVEVEGDPGDGYT